MKYKFENYHFPMKLFHLFLFSVLFVLFLHVKCSDGYLSLFSDKEEEPYTWPKRIGGINDDSGSGLAPDSENNIIITGYITGSVDLNNDGDISDEFENDDADSSTDIFIIKYSARGTFEWAKRLGGVSDDKGYAVTVDSLDNIIVTGSVIGDADLNSDGDYLDDGELATGYGLRDIFIVKLDSSGNYQWSKRLGGASDDNGQSIVADWNDNIVATGIIEGDADINADGVVDSGLPETATSTYKKTDIFVSKFDSLGNNLLSIRLGGNNTLIGDFNSIAAIDINNNIILTGSVTSGADLDGNDLVSGFPETPGGENGWSDIFISKFDSSGTWQWAKRLGGGGPDVGFGITTDRSNNVIVTGMIDQDADINGDDSINAGLPETPTAAYGSWDIFVSKFDSLGYFQWSRRLGGTENENGSYLGNNITADPADNVFVIGEVQGDADLNANGNSTDGGAEDSSAYGSYDIFITKFDSSGAWQWAKRLGGEDADEAANIIVSNNNIFITGYVTGNADLDGDGNIALQTDESSTLDFPEDATDFGGKDIIISVFANQ